MNGKLVLLAVTVAFGASMAIPAEASAAPVVVVLNTKAAPAKVVKKTKKKRPDEKCADCDPNDGTDGGDGSGDGGGGAGGGNDGGGGWTDGGDTGDTGVCNDAVRKPLQSRVDMETLKIHPDSCDLDDFTYAGCVAACAAGTMSAWCGFLAEVPVLFAICESAALAGGFTCTNFCNARFSD